MLSLRTAEGLDLEAFRREHGFALETVCAPTLARIEAEGLGSGYRAVCADTRGHGRGRRRGCGLYFEDAHDIVVQTEERGEGHERGRSPRRDAVRPDGGRPRALQAVPASMRPRRGRLGDLRRPDGSRRRAVHGGIRAGHRRPRGPHREEAAVPLPSGSSSLSIATVGCNFRCAFCQNWSISQVRRKLSEGTEALADAVVRAAVDGGCRSISFTYTEPTVFFEYAYDCAVLARGRGIETVFVTNGFMTPEAIETNRPLPRRCERGPQGVPGRHVPAGDGGRLEPVLESLRELRRRGIWVEVTTLVVPEMNDSDEELGTSPASSPRTSPGGSLAREPVPPDHEMLDARATSVAALQRATRQGREADFGTCTSATSQARAARTRSATSAGPWSSAPRVLGARQPAGARRLPGLREHPCAGVWST